MTTYATALAAIADPTRRRLLEKLRAAPASVGELTEAAAVSQPAVSQHLRILEKARLVSVEPQGARRIYRLSPEGLAEIRAYIEWFWQDALEAFATKAEEEARPSRARREERG